MKDAPRDERGMNPDPALWINFPASRLPGKISSGGERTRTADFHVANVALYQLSYTPGHDTRPSDDSRRVSVARSPTIAEALAGFGGYDSCRQDNRNSQHRLRLSDNECLGVLMATQTHPRTARVVARLKEPANARADGSCGQLRVTRCDCTPISDHPEPDRTGWVALA